MAFSFTVYYPFRVNNLYFFIFNKNLITKHKDIKDVNVSPSTNIVIDLDVGFFNSHCIMFLRFRIIIIDIEYIS